MKYQYPSPCKIIPIDKNTFRGKATLGKYRDKALVILVLILFSMMLNKWCTGEYAAENRGQVTINKTLK